MELVKQQILDKGYTLCLENENGCSFINKEIQFCVLILKTFSNEESESWNGLYESLKKEAQYIKKTIAVILHTEEDKEEINRDPYWFAKIFPEQISSIPSVKKDITVNIVPMKDVSDVGDFTFNLFDYYDALATTSYLDFLVNKAQDGCVIKYARIMDWQNVSHVRYITEKLVNDINYEK